ncbi:helix-turn-helix transcriptional regulator [uncultured Clostridium sp.]|uniref:helix-turn-helix domain-containing protein n=1 Tax=uncultured Clostridium sp. TaxID=59620 RepID=UPI0028E298FB|nr:helix-turn-helix transcriptional regulator [uncultured Clostridium sp.]
MKDLRITRTSRGIARKFVAKRLGFSPDHLSNIERGCTPLKIPEVKKLADIYGIKFSEMAEIALATYEGGN